MRVCMCMYVCVPCPSAEPVVCCVCACARPQNRFLPVSLDIHWLSLGNSLLVVLLLMAFLTLLLMRIVKSDFTR